MTSNVDIEEYLTSADPALGRLIRAVLKIRKEPIRVAPSKASPFESLIRAIVYQQMATSAAGVIYERLKRIAGSKITPKRILEMTHRDLCRAGLSNTKAQFAHNVADWFGANPKLARELRRMTNDEVTKTLTAIKGIGEWSANVFLIFTLGRLDVVPAFDLGIQRAVHLIDGLKNNPTPGYILKRSRRWKPYESIASMYLWQSGRLKITAASLNNTSE